MLSRRLCAAAICLFGLAPQAEATESSGLVRRASCTVVRFYVAKYTASAAEMWAFFAKSAGGGNSRVSLSTLVMFLSGEDMVVLVGWDEALRSPTGSGK